MKENLVYKNGHLKKPSNDVMSCKFRGIGVECERSDWRSGFCEFCGWNPKVQADRIARMMKDA